jgi:hypothetical protein
MHYLINLISIAQVVSVPILVAVIVLALTKTKNKMKNPLSDRAVAYRKAIENLTLCEDRWNTVCREYHDKDVLNETETRIYQLTNEAFKSAQKEMKNY